MKYMSEPTGLKVQRVVRNSQAAAAGISANDVIVAIDGLKRQKPNKDPKNGSKLHMLKTTNNWMKTKPKIVSCISP